VLHAPQWSSVACRSTHEELQSVRPESQTHAPFVQRPLVGHARPHAPQLSMFESRGTQELPHAVSPLAHLATHFPCEHFSSEWHGVPHAPQFAASDEVSLHAPLHDSLPNGHVHLPPRHVMPLLHAALHPPQLFVFVVTSTQMPLQNVMLGSEQLSWQRPPAQRAPVGHANPHRPQFFGSLWVSPHAPPPAPPSAGALVFAMHAVEGVNATDKRRSAAVTITDRTRP
jgi:hypothetical protein